MSLTSAFQIGRSALTASQLGLQVAGNNLANAATPGYSRQSINFSPTASQYIGNGISIGRGVTTDSVRRQIDSALQARLNQGLSRESAGGHRASVYASVETTIGELNDNDFSSELSSFFNTWSERANLTKSSAAVIQQGDRLATYVRRQRENLGQLRDQIDTQIGAAVTQADGLAQQIADLNSQIASAEVNASESASLRDQRDNAIAQLSQLVDVTVIDNGAQGVNVMVGSEPIVTGGASRGITMRRISVGGEIVVKVSTRVDPADLSPTSGQIGSMLDTRTTAVDNAISKLNDTASQLIFQVNRLHSTGTNRSWLRSTAGTLAVPTADRSRPINDPANLTLASLPFHADNGGFTVTVRQGDDGPSQTIRINVDLDGVTAAGLPGTTDDTTPEQLRAALDAIPGVSASWGSDGKLKLDADAGFSFALSDDSSGALAVFGLNAYFEGSAADSIAVRSDLLTDPERLAVGRVVDGQFVENGNALRLADLKDTRLASLGDRSISDFWRDHVQQVGTQSASARTEAQAAADVRMSLENQRAAISGVSTDEESINLLTFQRQYQGAAKLISVADEMMNSLLNLV